MDFSHLKLSTWGHVSFFVAAIVLSCTSYYHPKNPAAVRVKCGPAPWASSDTIGYNADQSNWNECAEHEDKRIAQDPKEAGGQARTATNQQPGVSQHKPSVGGVPNSDSDRPIHLAGVPTGTTESSPASVTDTTTKSPSDSGSASSSPEAQQECQNKVLEVIDGRRMAWVQKVLDECPKTRLPRGTYKSAKGSPVYVELEVTDKGCAAYMTVINRTWTVTKTYESDQGYYSRDYNRDLYCESNGIVTSDQRTDPMGYSGQCAIPHASLSKNAVWNAHGTAISVTETGLPTIQLQRRSATIEAVDGLPRLWPKGRRVSDDQARISVAFARPGSAHPTSVDGQYQLPDPPPRVSLDSVT